MDKPAHAVSVRLPQSLPGEIARLRGALDAGGIGTWEWHRGSPLILGDAKAAELLGLGPGLRENHAMLILRRAERNDRRLLLTALRGALNETQHIAVDVAFRCFDGAHRWIAIRAASTGAGDGRASGLSGIAYDVTDHKQNLARTDALLREVSHRTKNLLALILAMARLTARHNFDVKTYLKHFALRVAGLSVSQDVIVAADWQTTDLAALALAEVDAVARASAARIAISGPSVAVTPEVAQSLGIIIAELTLNALEHGALSVPDGHVRLSWDFPDETRLHFSWHETGGPDFDPASPKGYGMTIVDRLSAQGLKAKVALAREDGGFLWTFDAPLHSIGERPPPHRS